MRNNDEIMNYIDKLKAEQNLSISEIARRVNMAKSGVSRYFNRTRPFPVNKVDLFAKALHTTPENILGISKENDELTANLYELLQKMDKKTKEEVLEFAEFKLFEQKNKSQN